MIVVAGEALVDLVQRTDGSLHAAPGGGPYNTARTIARLGRRVGLLAAISDDRFGARLFEGLVESGVDTSLVQRSPAPTTLAVAELDDDGAASYRFYLDGTAAPSLVADPTLIAAAHEGRVAAVHVGTLGLVLEPMASTIVDLVEAMPAHVTVMVDPNYRPAVITDRPGYLERLARVLRRADVAKVSTDDVELLAPGIDPVSYAAGLVADGTRIVLVTGGDQASFVVTADGSTTLDTPPVAVVDTIGAGDSFGGGFLVAWLRGAAASAAPREFHDLAVIAARAAQQVASITVQRAGAEPPWRRELDPAWGTAPAPG
jgi:fructokinase